MGVGSSRDSELLWLLWFLLLSGFRVTRVIGDISHWNYVCPPRRHVEDVVSVREGWRRTMKDDDRGGRRWKEVDMIEDHRGW